MNFKHPLLFGLLTLLFLSSLSCTQSGASLNLLGRKFIDTGVCEGPYRIEGEEGLTYKVSGAGQGSFFLDKGCKQPVQASFKIQSKWQKRFAWKPVKGSVSRKLASSTPNEFYLRGNAFYYFNPTEEEVSLKAVDLEGEYQEALIRVTIKKGAVKSLIVVGPSSLRVGECQEYQLQTRSRSGESPKIPGNLSIEFTLSGGGSLYEDKNCSTVLSAMTFLQNENSLRFYFMPVNSGPNMLDFESPSTWSYFQAQKEVAVP